MLLLSSAQCAIPRNGTRVSELDGNSVWRPEHTGPHHMSSASLGLNQISALIFKTYNVATQICCCSTLGGTVAWRLGEISFTPYALTRAHR